MMTYSNFTFHQETVDLPVFLNYLNIIIALGAIFLNVPIIYAYLVDREIRRVPVHFLILSLSISDEFTGVSLLIHFIWAQNGAFLPPPSFNVPCLVWASITYLSVVSSAFLVILISWDRLQMITHPFKHRQFTRRRAVLQVALLWIFLLVYQLFILSLAQVITSVIYREDTLLKPGPCIVSSVNGRYAYISIIFDFLIPSVVLFVINGLVGVRIGRLTVSRIEMQRLEAGSITISTLSDADIPIDKTSTSSVVSTRRFYPGKTTHAKRTFEDFPESSRAVYLKVRKAIRLMFLFVSVYMICWYPIHIALIMKSFMDVPPWIMHFLYLVAGLSSAINPFLYAFMSNKYRKRLNLLMRFRMR